MRRCWRTFGGARFELDASARTTRTAQRWLGRRGWRPGAGPPGSIGIRIEDVSGSLRCTAPSLTDELAGTHAVVLGELEYLCTTRALASSRRPAALHAALVSRGARSALLVGAHASGKTTLALGLCGRGYRVWGDDIALLDTAGAAVALPRPLRVRPPTMQLLPQLAARLRRCGVFDDEENIYRIDTAALDKAALAAPAVRDVVFIHRARGGLRVFPMSSAEAIPAALGQTFSTRPRDVRTARAVVALFERARAWRINGSGSPAAIAAMLDEVFYGDVLTESLSLAAR